MRVIFKVNFKVKFIEKFVRVVLRVRPEGPKGLLKIFGYIKQVNCNLSKSVVD